MYTYIVQTNYALGAFPEQAKLKLSSLSLYLWLLLFRLCLAANIEMILSHSFMGSSSMFVYDIHQ